MGKKNRVPEPERSAFESAKAAFDRVGEDYAPVSKTVELSKPAVTPETPVSETPDSIATPETDRPATPATDSVTSSDTSTTSVPEPDAVTTSVPEPDTPATSEPDADTVTMSVSEPDAVTTPVSEADADTTSVPDADTDTTSVLEADTDITSVLDADTDITSVLETDADTTSVPETDTPATPETSIPDTDSAVTPLSEDVTPESESVTPEFSDEPDEDTEPFEDIDEADDSDAFGDAFHFPDEPESEVTEMEKLTMETKEITLGIHRSPPKEADTEPNEKQSGKKARFQVFDRLKNAFRVRADESEHTEESLSEPPSTGSSRDAAIRKRVMQIEDEETRNYLLDRVLPQMTWYSKKSAQYQTMYYRLMAATILMGALIPAFSVGANHTAVKVILALLGASVTGINAYLALHNYHDLWITYRTTREDLIHHLYCYFNKAGVFSSSEDLNVLLVNVCEDTLSKENGGWTTIIQKTPTIS